MFIPNELMRWGDWKNEVCCMCSVLAPVDSLSLQKFSKEIVANVCKTCGNVASTFHWTFACSFFLHFDNSMTLLAHIPRFFCHFFIGKVHVVSIQTAATHTQKKKKKKQYSADPRIFSTARPPPRRLKGRTGLKVLQHCITGNALATLATCVG